MLLAIDVGNTNSVIALYDGDRSVATWRTSTSSTRTADEYAVWLSQLMMMAGFKLSDINDCVISNVVPQSLFHFRNLSRRYFKRPFVVTAKSIPGVEVRIPKPTEAGGGPAHPRSRLCRLWRPARLVDSGTATNFDVVGADGGFEGGIIAPGINLSMQALHDAAAQLRASHRAAARRRQGYCRRHAVRRLLGLYQPH
ncbi:MAG: type III pantothenate kinase [Parvularculaceae bacterium]